MKDNFFLRKAVDDDASTISKYLANNKINQFLSSSFRKKHSSIFIKLLFKKKDNVWYVFGKNKKILGSIVLDSIDYSDKIANIWYFNSNNRMHRKNFTYRAISEIINKNELKLNCLTAWTLDDNYKSIKLLTKLNFEKLGEIENTFYFKKKYQNRVIFKRKL